MVTIEEINRRIAILESKKPMIINKRMLRGGMDYRNRRKEIHRYNKSITDSKNILEDKLAILEKPAEETFFGISSTSVCNDVLAIEDKFNEPKLRRTRKGSIGFF